MPGEVTAGLKFGEAVAKLWVEHLKSRDRRRMKKAIDYGEKYILCDKGFGEYEKQTPAQKNRRKSQYSHRFFKYNN